MLREAPALIVAVVGARVANVVAGLWCGRMARREFDEAVRDIAAMPLPDAVARRALAPKTDATLTLALRAFRRALVVVAERAAPGHACLPRSLALFGEARRRGLAVQLVVGVRDDDGDLASHAWLTLDGAPFLETPESSGRFRIIADLPPQPGDR